MIIQYQNINYINFYVERKKIGRIQIRFSSKDESGYCFYFLTVGTDPGFFSGRSDPVPGKTYPESQPSVKHLNRFQIILKQGVPEGSLDSKLDQGSKSKGSPSSKGTGWFPLTIYARASNEIR